MVRFVAMSMVWFLLAINSGPMAKYRGFWGGGGAVTSGSPAEASAVIAVPGDACVFPAQLPCAME